ncbi:alpha1 protein [Malakal virus]|uniref:Alpha1 protein n=1 Tax=Malakal virus TaxID=1229186 RepID=J9TGW1_9RHAB|nr:alpha1 protein [Malakal virus]AFR67113.1 alpha1 protein [Malakal virus]
MEKFPFQKPFDEIKNWLIESRDKISEWWNLTEWRIRLGFYIIISLIIGIALSKILIKIFKCINTGVSGVRKLRKIIRRKKKVKSLPSFKEKRKPSVAKFKKFGNK